MSIIGFARAGIWRQAASLIVAYAFALQVALFGLLMPGPAADPESLGALCLHDQGALPPLQDNGGTVVDHCKLCTIGGHAPLLAPAAIVHFTPVAADKAPRLAAAWFIPRPVVHPSARPRGPPQAA